MSLPPRLYSAEDIAVRLGELCRTLAALPDRPQVAVPVLVGAFVFAADLLRGLAQEGLLLQTEMIWLRSYGAGRHGGALTVLAAPGPAVTGRHLLLIDGVLDSGHTIARAAQLLRQAGAASIRSVVAVDKRRSDAVAHADYALYSGVTDFVIGYGMDDGGEYRGLPYIGKAEI